MDVSITSIVTYNSLTKLISYLVLVQQAAAEAATTTTNIDIGVPAPPKPTAPIPELHTWLMGSGRSDESSPSVEELAKLNAWTARLQRLYTRVLRILDEV